MALGMEKRGRGSRLTVLKKSVVMDTGIRPRIVHFSSAMAMESIMDEVGAQKKFKGFPLFFIFKIVKTAFLGDIKQ
jgi:hypothetical protein